MRRTTGESMCTCLFFITRFVRRCQENCIYDDFPSDKSYRLTLDGYGFGIGRVGGHPCNSLTYSILQLLLVFKVINYPPPDCKREWWCHEICEKRPCAFV